MPQPQYLTNAQIDYDKWDICMECAVNGMAYGFSWYLDIVAPEWDALVLGDYEAVMPLPHRCKLGIHYLFQPPFVQQLGVFSIFSLNQSLIRRFLAAIPPHFKWIDIHLNEGNNFSVKKFETQSRRNYLLFLYKSYEEQYHNYNNNTKRNLKKAFQKGWTVQSNTSPEEMVDFYKTNLSAKLPYVNEVYCNQLLQIMYKSIHRGKGVIKGIYDEHNQLCAAAFFLKSHNRFINLAPVTNQVGRENGAMFLIIDDLIRTYQETDYMLDFEGSMVPSIARFFKGFGANEVAYCHIWANRLPWWIRWAKK